MVTLFWIPTDQNVTSVVSLFEIMDLGGCWIRPHNLQQNQRVVKKSVYHMTPLTLCRYFVGYIS